MLQAHLQIEELHAKYAILPGDPKRIDIIKQFLDDAVEVNYNREYRIVEGKYKGVDVVALSTGMGGASMAIAVEELHNLGVEVLVRVGSAGAMQKGINLGDQIIVEGAIRNDGASKTYVDVAYPAVANHEVLEEMIKAAQKLKMPYHCGIIQSHESFYHDSNEEEEQYWHTKGVLGSDFESAALFTVGRLRNVKCASILNNVVVFGQDSADAVADYASGGDLCAIGEKREIAITLEAFYQLANK